MPGGWGVVGVLPLLPFISFIFSVLRTLLRFSALTQNSTRSFSSGCALFAKNTRGVPFFPKLPGGGASMRRPFSATSHDLTNHQSPPSVPLRRAAHGATMASQAWHERAVIVLGPVPGAKRRETSPPSPVSKRRERTGGSASARRRSRLKFPAWPGSQVVPGSTVLTVDRHAGWSEPASREDADFPSGIDDEN
jgi:hypothetical protein